MEKTDSLVGSRAPSECRDTSDPNRHNRRSIRLKGFDYASVGAYFVTLCVQRRECLLGEITGEEVELNAAGKMVEEWWQKIQEKFANAVLDEFLVMPNHIHGIIRIVGADPCVRPGLPDPRVRSKEDRKTGAGQIKGAHMGAPLPRMMQWFKTMSTNAYIQGVKGQGWPPFPSRLWQRNYYERVIRDEDELHRARRYIQENPLKWEMDEENPVNAR